MPLEAPCGAGDVAGRLGDLRSGPAPAAESRPAGQALSKNRASESGEGAAAIARASITTIALSLRRETPADGGPREQGRGLPFRGRLGAGLPPEPAVRGRCCGLPSSSMGTSLRRVRAGRGVKQAAWGPGAARGCGPPRRGRSACPRRSLT